MLAQLARLIIKSPRHGKKLTTFHGWTIGLVQCFLRVLLSFPLHMCRISYGSCTLSSTLYNNCNDIAVICMAHCCMVNVVICVHCMIFIPIIACLWRIGWYLVIICSQVLCVIFPYLLFLVLFFASTVFLYFLTYVLTHIALYPK